MFYYYFEGADCGATILAIWTQNAHLCGALGMPAGMAVLETTDT